MQRIRVKTALASDAPMDFIRIQGWVRTRRDSKGFSFLEINDGSCLKNIQVIIGLCRSQGHPDRGIHRGVGGPDGITR